MDEIDPERPYHILIAGSGGQGIILAGLVFSEAAAVFDGKNVTQTQSYAPLARGAPSKTEIIISNAPIDYPKIEQADIFLAMNEESYEKYINTIAKEAITIADAYYIEKSLTKKTILVPITEISKKVTGKAITASMTALGIITRLTGIITLDALINAARRRVPPGTEDMNEKAIQAGYNAELGCENWVRETLKLIRKRNLEKGFKNKFWQL